jgi:crossover junction endodeoxyribonuclease RusA
MTVRVEIPQPPSVNTLYLNVRGKGRVKSDAYKRWLQEAGWAVKLTKPGSVSGPCRLWYTIPRPTDRRKRDIGNLEKPLTDLLVSYGVIDDDSKVQGINIEYGDTDCVVALVEPADKQAPPAG